MSQCKELNDKTETCRPLLIARKRALKDRGIDSMLEEARADMKDTDAQNLQRKCTVTTILRTHFTDLLVAGSAGTRHHCGAFEFPLIRRASRRTTGHSQSRVVTLERIGQAHSAATISGLDPNSFKTPSDSHRVPSYFHRSPQILPRCARLAPAVVMLQLHIQDAEGYCPFI